MGILCDKKKKGEYGIGGSLQFFTKIAILTTIRVISAIELAQIQLQTCSFSMLVLYIFGWMLLHHKKERRIIKSTIVHDCQSFNYHARNRLGNFPNGENAVHKMEQLNVNDVKAWTNEAANANKF